MFITFLRFNEARNVKGGTGGRAWYRKEIRGRDVL